MNQFLKSVALLVMAAFALAVQAEDLPKTTHDGLELVPDTKVRAVYMKPGADLSEYDKVAILDVYVAFKKNWQRDQNREALGTHGRVSDKDVQQIRDALAEEFRKIFVDELSTKGGHEVVSEGGEGVLILRPAIINLDITAPDLMEAGRSRSFVASAGQMTLYMELYDGATGDIIARIIDPEALDPTGTFQYSNRVTNKADADRILRRWASLLDSHLAEVKSMDSKQ